MIQLLTFDWSRTFNRKIKEIKGEEETSKKTLKFEEIGEYLEEALEVTNKIGKFKKLSSI
jgi:hypothetical protein